MQKKKKIKEHSSAQGCFVIFVSGSSCAHYLFFSFFFYIPIFVFQHCIPFNLWVRISFIFFFFFFFRSIPHVFAIDSVRENGQKILRFLSSFKLIFDSSVFLVIRYRHKFTFMKIAATI